MLFFYNDGDKLLRDIGAKCNDIKQSWKQRLVFADAARRKKIANGLFYFNQDQEKSYPSFLRMRANHYPTALKYLILGFYTLFQLPIIAIKTLLDAMFIALKFALALVHDVFWSAYHAVNIVVTAALTLAGFVAALGLFIPGLIIGGLAFLGWKLFEEGLSRSSLVAKFLLGFIGILLMAPAAACALAVLPLMAVGLVATAAEYLFALALDAVEFGYMGLSIGLTAGFAGLAKGLHAIERVINQGLALLAGETLNAIYQGMTAPAEQVKQHAPKGNLPSLRGTLDIFMNDTAVENMENSLNDKQKSLLFFGLTPSKPAGKEDYSALLKEFSAQTSMVIETHRGNLRLATRAL